MPPNEEIQLRPADLDDTRVHALLVAHSQRARAETGAGSAHALDFDAFRAPDIHLWAAWEGKALLGLGAWKELTPTHGELKSFHTVEAARGRGIAGRILTCITGDAQRAGVTRLSLETGSWPYFAPARAFYARHGFETCGPFGDYVEDPNSVFMTRLV